MVLRVTTEGLQDLSEAESTLPDTRWADATGTGNAILAAYTPEITELTDGLVLGFRASAANTSTTPTFAPDDMTAHTITKQGGGALAAGDIPAADAEVLVRYNLANTRWELLMLTPAVAVVWAAAGGGVDTLTATYTPAITSLTDGLLLGVRAGGANATATPTFSPNGLTARTITQLGGVALKPGSIYGSNHELLLRYNLANTRWELLNPADMAGELYKILEADENGTDVSTAQPWFPTAGGVSVLAGQRYLIEGFLYLSRAAGAVSHTTGVLFGGTATFTQIVFQAGAKEGDANTLADLSVFTSFAATEIVLKAASTSTTEQVMIYLRGEVRINAAGTVIPQFKYNAAPGGAPAVKAGSWFRMVPLAAVSKGTWA